MHTLRVIQALSRLRLPPWPFPGAIAIVEEDPSRTRRELHVAHDWRYLGSVRTETEIDEVIASRTPRPPLNVDVFRLLQRTLQSPLRHPICRLDGRSGARE